MDLDGDNILFKNKNTTISNMFVPLLILSHFLFVVLCLEIYLFFKGITISSFLEKPSGFLKQHGPLARSK